MKDLDIRALADQDIEHKPCPPIQLEYRVIFQQEAFDKIVAQAHKDTEVEVGGVLVGHLLKDDSGPYLLVENIIDATQAMEARTEFTLTHESWEHINQKMDKNHADQRIVGWYHTHPAFGIFLSEQDVFIHKSFFNLPFQVALVYDPVARTHGCFSWTKGELSRLRCYWLGQNSQIWEESKETLLAKHKSKSPPRPSGEHGTVPPVVANEKTEAGDSNWNFNGVIQILLLALLVGGVGGYFVRSFLSVEHRLEIERHVEQARVEGVRETVRALRSDLLLTLNSAADREVIDPALTDIAKILTGTAQKSGIRLPPSTPSGNKSKDGKNTTPTLDPAALLTKLGIAQQGLNAALEKLQKLRTDRYKSQRLLNTLTREQTIKEIDTKTLMRESARSRVYLGQLFAELAEMAFVSGDKQRSKRLFSAAAIVNPSNHPQYQKRLEALLPKDTLPPPTSPSQPPKNLQKRQGSKTVPGTPLKTGTAE